MTRATHTKPVRRIVAGRYGDEYIAEVYLTRLELRPKGSRSAKVRVSVDFGGLYQRGLVAQLEAEKKAKHGGKVKVKR